MIKTFSALQLVVGAPRGLVLKWLPKANVASLLPIAMQVLLINRPTITFWLIFDSFYILNE
jgi:hypothetical protein